MHGTKAKYFQYETWANNDGDGIRLVIFLQGCWYRCLYCHNPESWTTTQKQSKTISVKKVLQLYQEGKEFYQPKGGITLSGGEPLLQKKFVLKLAKKCFHKKISLAIDTSGCCFITQNKSYFKKLIKYVDLWIVDIKALDEKNHQKITSIAQCRELELIKFLDEQKKRYWIRYVLVKDLTSNEQSIQLLRQFLNSLHHYEKFELLPYHDLAKEKYVRLGIKYPLDQTIVLNKQENQTYLTKITQK